MFVPQRFVQLAWQAVKHEAPPLPRVQEFVTYCEETWNRGEYRTICICTRQRTHELMQNRRAYTSTGSIIVYATMHTYLTLYLIVMILFYRRRVEFRMLNEPSQSISSDDLTSLVSEIRSTTPYVGESLISGRLRSLGSRKNGPGASCLDAI